MLIQRIGQPVFCFTIPPKQISGGCQFFGKNIPPMSKRHTFMTPRLRGEGRPEHSQKIPRSIGIKRAAKQKA